MIPTYIAEIMDALLPDWAGADEDVLRDLVDAAYRLYDAGYRKVAEPTEMLTEQNEPVVTKPQWAMRSNDFS